MVLEGCLSTFCCEVSRLGLCHEIQRQNDCGVDSYDEYYLTRGQKEKDKECGMCLFFSIRAYDY